MKHLGNKNVERDNAFNGTVAREEKIKELHANSQEWLKLLNLFVLSILKNNLYLF